MDIQLHKNARTTPRIRQELQASSLKENELASQYGINRLTVRKWQNRKTIEDRSHRPHTIHATLNKGQESIVIYLREKLLLPLDDLLVIVREFIHPTMSRSALSRCLRRHGVTWDEGRVLAGFHN